MKYTKGPWRWFGNTDIKSLYLAAEHHGRLIVMDFVRWGMQDAQPRFVVTEGERDSKNSGLLERATSMIEYEVDYRKDITDIKHPDAKLIQKAPEMYDLLLKCLPIVSGESKASDDVTDQIESLIEEVEQYEDTAIHDM